MAQPLERRPRVKWISALLMYCFVSYAQAAVEPLVTAAQPVPPSVKTFQDWKDLQVLEAQNQLLRVGARMSQIRSGVGKGVRADLKEPAQLPSARVKPTAESDPMALAEKDLRRARESLETANALELSDYVNVYLPTLASQPEALQTLFQKLTKEELAEILKLLLARSSRIDAKRSSTLVGGSSARHSPTF